MSARDALAETPIGEVPITVVDVETTGLFPRDDRVVEIALIRTRGGRIQAEFATLVDPQRPIPPEVQRIHGITPAMVRGQPTFGDLAADVARFVGDSVLLGHNVNFDVRFLRAEFLRVGVVPLSRPTLDTLHLARGALHLSSYSLGVVAQSLGLPPSTHRAQGDAQLTLGVFNRLIEGLGGGQTTLAELHEAALRVPWSQRPAAPRPAGAAAYGPFRTGQRLFIRYQSPISGVSERVIEIQQIVLDGNVASLYAYCYERRDMRWFRADRIVRWHEVGESPAP